MCGCSKKTTSGWMTVIFTGEDTIGYRGRNTKRNYGDVSNGLSFQILRGDYDPNVMRTQ